MGNSGLGKQPGAALLTADLTFVAKKEDPRYGRVFLYQTKFTKETVALKEMISRSAPEFKKDVSLLTSRSLQDKQDKKADPANLVKIISFSTHCEDNLCTSFYKLDILMEYIDFDLEQDIKLRRNGNLPYPEPEIWQMLECLISALSTLQQLETCFGDLYPSKVLVTKERVYKLVDPILVTNDFIPAYLQRLTGEKTHGSYLSPQQMKSLANKMVNPAHNPYKSDVFALGLVVLHAATLSDCDGLYDWNANKFESDKLAQKLKALGKTYSQRLVEFTKKLLSEDEESRPDAAQLSRELHTFREFSKKSLKETTEGASEEEYVQSKEAGRKTDKQTVVRSGFPVEELEEGDMQNHESSFMPSKRPTERPTAQERSEGQSKNMIESQKSNAPVTKEQDNLEYKPPDEISKIINFYRNKFSEKDARTTPAPQGRFEPQERPTSQIQERATFQNQDPHPEMVPVSYHSYRSTPYNIEKRQEKQNNFLPPEKLMGGYSNYNTPGYNSGDIGKIRQAIANATYPVENTSNNIPKYQQSQNPYSSPRGQSKSGKREYSSPEKPNSTEDLYFPGNFSGGQHGRDFAHKPPIDVERIIQDIKAKAKSSSKNYRPEGTPSKGLGDVTNYNYANSQQIQSPHSHSKKEYLNSLRNSLNLAGDEQHKGRTTPLDVRVNHQEAYLPDKYSQKPPVHNFNPYQSNFFLTKPSVIQLSVL